MGVGGRQSVERRRATASSGGDAGEYPLDVPGHGDEAPFAARAREAAQQKLTESQRLFDDPEHRLRNLLAQRVKRPACRRRQPMRHRLDRRARAIPARPIRNITGRGASGIDDGIGLQSENVKGELRSTEYGGLALVLSWFARANGGVLSWFSG